MPLTDLHRLAETIADRPEIWREHVRFEEAERTVVQLHGDDQLDVYLLGWLEGHDTGFHDHDVSACAGAVAEGELGEEVLVVGGPPTQRRLESGGAYEFPARFLHRMFHDGGLPAVTVHAYSPPLRRMGFYEVEEDGRLARTACVRERTEISLPEVVAIVDELLGSAVSSDRSRV